MILTNNKIMKTIKWENPNKMKINTGHKTFDAQTNIISTGNIIANTIIGNHIRAFNDCHNGFENKESGHLQDWDLDKFDYVPQGWKDRMRANPDMKYILYEVFHHNSNGNKISHGMILTDYDKNHMHTYCARAGYNISFEILFTVRDYLCNNQPHNNG